MRVVLATLALCLVGAAAWGQAHRLAEPATPLGNAKPTPRDAPDTMTGAARPAMDRACLGERALPINAAEPLHVGIKTYPRTLKLRDHEVVLTFDDGPAGDTTPAILDALKDACVYATFFLIGRHAAEFPEIARREKDEGHSVGHHSQTHPAFTLRGFDTASAEHDIETGIATDERAVYGAGAKPERPHVPFFRFPGFADTRELLAFLDKREIAVFGADMWAADWLEMSPEHELQRVLGLLEAAPRHNGILLLHDTRPSTAAMLPALLAELRANHYTIAHLVYDPAAKPPALTTPAQGWSSETERIIGHLRHRIVPGSHHGAESVEIAPAGDGMSEPPPAEPPR